MRHCANCRQPDACCPIDPTFLSSSVCSSVITAATLRLAQILPKHCGSNLISSRRGSISVSAKRSAARLSRGEPLVGAVHLNRVGRLGSIAPTYVIDCGRGG